MPMQRALPIQLHTHTDHLSFELSFAGIPVIVDPGTYVYTSDSVARNEFRRTRKHNTVVFNETDQYEIPLDDLFSMKHYSYLNTTELIAEEKGISGVCGFSLPNKGNLIHKRRIAFNTDKRNLGIHDSFSFDGDQYLQWIFHLASGRKVELQDEKVYINVSPDQTLLFEFEYTGKLKFDILDDYVSPSYGRLLSSKTNCLSTSSSSDFTMSTFITPLNRI